MRGRHGVAACALAIGAGLISSLALSEPSAQSAPRRPHDAGGGAIVAQPVLGLPASRLEVIGASPGEAAGEAWAQGRVGAVPAAAGGQTITNAEVLLRYTDATGGWQIMPVADATGAPIPFTWQASEVTAAGDVALAGTDTGSGAQTLASRDPGGAFGEAPAPTATPGVLHSGESLYSTTTNTPAMATIDESGHAAVLIAPAGEDSVSPGVLHYGGGRWTREPMCAAVTAGACTPPTTGLAVAAVAASSQANAWLLAMPTSGPHGQPVLFERQIAPGVGEAWVQQSPSGWLLGSDPRPVGGETVAPPSSGAVLTAVNGGVWVDFALAASGGRTGNATTFISPAAAGEVVQTWCYPASLCPATTPSLGTALPAGYGSFAWPGTSATDPGTRIISGLPTAALLRLDEGATGFSYQDTSGDAPGALGGGGTFGPGGETLTSAGARLQGGAAFTSPSAAWLGTSLSPPQQTPEIVRLTTTPAAGALTAWPVPFRHPMLAVASDPTGTPGSTGASALAVGAGGEIARYTSGAGWSPEYLYNAAGVVQTPTMRGVAWPERDRAYAVGDGGAMWLWRAETGLWEPDPARPLNFHGNLTAIAFDPAQPQVGYAVGKQGVLLAYGKTWTQQTVPAAVAQAHFTSVAFAGDEPIVAYRMPDPHDPTHELGGVLVNHGSGWAIDPSASALLATLPPAQTVVSKVAGLPDGGAVAAGPGLVIERDSGTSAWRFSAEPLADSLSGNVSALAAIRDGSSVRALVSVDDDPESNPSGIANALWQEIDNPPAPAAGEPPLLIGPDPLPSHGFLVRETASGWVDAQFNDFPNQVGGYGASNGDLAGWPDAVLALVTDPAGDQGWAVGGQTGGDQLQLKGVAGSQAATVVQTAGIEHFGTGAAPPVTRTAPVTAPSGQVSFALGGGSGCVALCADNAAQNLGPDRWLTGAITEAGQIPGLRAFLYAGQRLGEGASGLTLDQYGREMSDYAGQLSASATVPTFAAATSADVSPATGGPAEFAALLGGHAPAGQVPSGTPVPPAGTAAYAFDSAGSGGTVRVIVVDYSAGTLSGGGGAQLQWLAAQLDAAKQAQIPAIVLGADDITNASAPNYAADAAAVSQTLLAHGASAYLFFDALQQNVQTTIGPASASIPVIGTGTLGYVNPPTNAISASAFLGASGFLLVSVNAGGRNAGTGRAPVTASLIPQLGGIALDAIDGTLLRRSHVALFAGLARRTPGGEEWVANSTEAPDPYTVLPQSCQGSACGQFVKPVYAFTSSDPSVGDFVAPDPTSPNPRQVLHDASGHPIGDGTSGLFCAYNPGTTTVSVTAGGLTYSETVTVQSGTVAEPCGTVPAANQTVSAGQSAPPPPPSPAPSPSPRVTASVPPPPPPHAPMPAPQHPRPVPASPHKPAPPLFGPGTVTPAAAIPPPVILPVPSVIARPIPPTGYGSVPVATPIPVRVVEEERKEEEAVESVRNSFAVYRPDESPNLLAPGVAVVLLVLAAGAAGASLRRPARGAAAYARTDVRSRLRADVRSRRRH